MRAVAEAGGPVDLTELLAGVHTLPPGPETVVAVDASALLAGSPDAAFASARLRAGTTPVSQLPAEVALVARAAAGAATGTDPDALARLVAGWAGRESGDVEIEARRLFVRETSSGLRPEVWDLVAEHRRAGHTVVLTTSATRFHVQALADDLGIDRIVATPVDGDGNVLSGELAGPVLDGAGKARAIGRVDVACSADPADAALLAVAARPVAVTTGDADPGLPGPRLVCEPRGGPWPGPGEVARTAGFYAAVAGAASTAAGVGLLRWSRRHVVDLTSSVAGDVGLALAGIDVEVTGTEHLWSARPCVFVFNHQSKLDVVLMMKLLRGGFTGVAKAEAARIPGWGQMFALAGVAFVDRGNTAQARDALEPAVRKVRDEGWSLAMAPEGTRSATPRLGRFKKGAFHIAMQAGVPMVPIVLHDAGAVMWRGAQTLRSGTVHVTVLPPVDTSGWSTRTLTAHVDEVRGMFLRTLGQDEGGTR